MKWKMKENLFIRRKATSNVNYVPGKVFNTVTIVFILEMKTLKLSEVN